MISPLRDVVALSPVDQETTSSGIFVSGPKDLPNRFTVVSVGPDVVGFSVGEQVFAGRYAGDLLDTPEGSIKFVRAEEILAKILA